MIPADGKGMAPGEEAAEISLSDETFAAQVLQSQLPVLVDFWAPWCGPCRVMSPLISEIARAFAGRLKVAKLNTDESPRIASQYSVMSIPTLLLFKDGRAVERVVGVLSKAKLEERLASHL
jgi:thioredoxin 1